MGLSNIVSHKFAVGARASTLIDTPPFTRREMEVAKWLAWGKTNDEIGRILEISPFTVKNHIQRILIKLNASNRTQAVSRAVGLGIVGTGSRAWTTRIHP